MEEEGAPTFVTLPVQAQDLLRYYEARCGTAVKRGSSLIMAIPKGLSADCVAINLELTKQAMLNQHAASYCEVIDDLFAASPLQLAPCMDAYTEDDEERMPKLERVMRHGYARDRVIGINKIKKGMLNQGKVGASQDFILKQTEGISFMKRWFDKFEEGILNVPDVAKPSVALATKREQWRRLVDSDPESVQNQTTFVQATALHGTTRLQVEALAMDPVMQYPETLHHAAKELLRQGERDKEVGTETFVAFTFPPEEHELLVAAAGVGGGIAKTETSNAYPSHVTFHSPTGDATSLAVAGVSGSAPNALFVGDTAYLMAQIHALAADAKRSCVLLEHS